ncbi:Pyridoxal 5'-phosphate synthase subunit snz1, partial [Coemansia sp. BCRC 34301]
MPTKAEREREARIEARKKEAEKKRKERDDKKNKLVSRLEANVAKTKAERVRSLADGIMVEVLNTVQAQLAQEAGFNAVLPYDSAATNINPRSINPREVRSMLNAVLIPVIARVQVGHYIEAKMAERLGASIIEEFDAAGGAMGMMGMMGRPMGGPTGGAAGAVGYIEKESLAIPVMCPIDTLDECFKRIDEGATMLRTKENPQQKAFAFTLAKIRGLFKELKARGNDSPETRNARVGGFKSKDMDKRYDEAVSTGKLPVPLFAYGGIATAYDVAMVRKIGCGVIISNVAFQADNPRKRLKAL